jgi:negative regulator of sigma-B (phosphoserine phosphatase)
VKAIGIATRPAPHETANGDRAIHLVRGRIAIYGVIDGLGHGPKAEEAALMAVAALEATAAEDVNALFTAAHGALRGTRGAAMTLVVVDGTRCEAAGVGNVTLRARRVKGLSLAATPGILGGQMRSLRLTHGELEHGARLAIWSDGVSSRAPLDDYTNEPAERAAQRMLAEHGILHDDGTILVADF